MRTARLGMPLLVVLMAVGTLVTPAPAAAATGVPSSGTSPVTAQARTSLELAAEAYMIRAHNDQRRAGSSRDGSSYGDVSRQPRLQPWTDMMTVSRRWSDTIGIGNFRHNPDHEHQYGYRSAWGENIALRSIKPTSQGPPTRSEVLATSRALMQQWWESRSHRRNWMDDIWDHFSVGASIQRDRSSSGTEYWVLTATANFRRHSGTIPSRWHAFPADGSPPPNEAGDGRFRDVPTHHRFHDDIEALAASGITTGCGSGSFCPDRTVTRGEMAAFLDRALGLRDGSVTFRDTRRHRFATSISALATNDITTGCGSGRFCPERPVTRGEMAAFLDRALGLPTGSATFRDSRRHRFRDSISALATAGITRGCNSARSRFCPDAPVTRAQMAAFLVRADLAD